MLHKSTEKKSLKKMMIENYNATQFGLQYYFTI